MRLWRLTRTGETALDGAGALNPLHPDAARVRPLVTRPFSFAECLHTPPMLARYSDASDAPT